MRISFVASLCILASVAVAQDKMAKTEESAKAVPVAATNLKPLEQIFPGARELAQTRTLKSISGSSIGEARLTVKDWKGEPVAKDVFIKLEVKCAGQNSFKSVGRAFNTCELVGIDHDRSRETLVIRYHPPTIIRGEFGCDSVVSTREYKINCKD